jgi:hypothetical protein
LSESFKIHFFPKIKRLVSQYRERGLYQRENRKENAEGTAAVKRSGAIEPGRAKLKEREIRVKSKLKFTVTESRGGETGV